MKTEKHVLPEIVVEYRGHKIRYTEDEQWEVQLAGRKKPESNKSIELVKRAIDRTFRKPFDRIKVLVEKSSSGYGGSFKFEEAEITSVGIEGEVFAVREGSKTAEQIYTYYLDTPENRKAMKSIEETKEKIEKMRVEASNLERPLYDRKRKLKEFDKDALVKKVLGE